MGDQIVPEDAKPEVVAAAVEEHVEKTKTDDPYERIGKVFEERLAPVTSAVAALSKTVEALDERIEAVEKGQESRDDRQEPSQDLVDVEKVMAGVSTPRVVSPLDHYDGTRKAAVYPQYSKMGTPHGLAGQRVYGWDRRPLDEPSERDYAVIGAFVKWQTLGLRFHPDPLRGLDDESRQIVEKTLHEYEWTGRLRGLESGNVVRGRLNEFERKAVIDDTTSGGSYAVPVPFDETVWIAPLLFGELVPYVTTDTYGQGSSVAGFTVGRLTATWNQTEGSAYSLPSTSGLISNLDTTFFNLMIGVELGLDWLSDARPANLGQVFVQAFGEEAQKQLDYVIAVGNGTSQPEGIFTKSGVNTVTSSNGTPGPYVVSDFEQQLFGLPKQYRDRNDPRVRWVTSDKQYRRALSVAVGTSDARRVFSPNMTHEDYMLMGRPVSIQNDVSNGATAICNLRYYTLKRREGITFRRSTEGQNLILKNTMLLTARMRYGGQVAIAESVTKCTTGDSTDG